MLGHSGVRQALRRSSSAAAVGADLSDKRQSAWRRTAGPETNMSICTFYNLGFHPVFIGVSVAPPLVTGLRLRARESPVRFRDGEYLLLFLPTSSDAFARGLSTGFLTSLPGARYKSFSFFFRCGRATCVGVSGMVSLLRHLFLARLCSYALQHPGLYLPSVRLGPWHERIRPDDLLDEPLAELPQRSPEVGVRAEGGLLAGCGLHIIASVKAASGSTPHAPGHSGRSRSSSWR